MLHFLPDKKKKKTEDKHKQGQQTESDYTYRKLIKTTGSHSLKMYKPWKIIIEVTGAIMYPSQMGQE